VLHEKPGRDENLGGGRALKMISNNVIATRVGRWEAAQAEGF
jgi:hypothetical protein